MVKLIQRDTGLSDQCTVTWLLHPNIMTEAVLPVILNFFLDSNGCCPETVSIHHLRGRDWFEMHHMENSSHVQITVSQSSLALHQCQKQCHFFGKFNCFFYFTKLLLHIHSVQEKSNMSKVGQTDFKDTVLTILFSFTLRYGFIIGIQSAQGQN